MGAPSPTRGLRFYPSRQASWILISTYRHGKVKIVAAGRESSAAKKTGHVVKLNLRRSFQDCNNVGIYYPDNKSRGSISNSLVNLQQLRHLDLSCNVMYGSKIPEFIGSMAHLRYLNLSFTLLHGRIPPQFGNLTKLIYLDLNCWSWYNPLNTYPFSIDLAWLPQLSSLKYLDTSYVNISTALDWAHDINMLPTLEVLNLRCSGLRYTVPSLRHFNLTALKRLDISENYFHTTISPHWFIWNATSLTFLSLRFCYFYGPIPDEIGRMKSLEQVSFIGSNLVSTMIPKGFKNLCNLKVLDLEYTNTSGDLTELMERLPNCHWNKLQELDLSFNSIGGEFPDQPGPLTNLTYLMLSYNKLAGKIPSWIGALRKLYILDLSYNQIDGTVNEDLLNGLADLKFLRLSHTFLQMKIKSDWIPPFQLLGLTLDSVKLGPAFPPWLKSQTSIANILIPNASITAIPDWFWDVFSGATALDLAYNQISGELPATLEFMSAENLVFSNNRISGAVPIFPINATHIDISENLLSGQLPSDFGAPRLETLMLYNNSISGIIPSSLCSLRYLHLLDLSTNMLTGEVPNCQQEMNYLLVMNLNTNNISGEFPPIFKSCPNARLVDLSYNQFSGSLPSWIWEKMPSIVLLSLRSNMFNGSIPNGLAVSKELQFLDLAHNNLSGSIPQSLVNLNAVARTSGYSELLYLSITIRVPVAKYNYMYDVIPFKEEASVSIKGQQLEFFIELAFMVNIDLSCNSLTGVIPRDIGILDGLKGLNLSWNRLSGEIPVNIGQLKQLESLDLSHNELSGIIPSSMSTLTSLSRINLSYNYLSGKIPTGNQFETFEASAYIGNIGLCGYPLTENCPGNASSRQDMHGHHLDLEDSCNHPVLLNISKCS